MENITKAIIKVMSEVKNIWKNTTVWTGTNSYKAVSDADVKRAIRLSMEANWLSIICTWVTSRMKIDRWEEVDTWSKIEPKPMKTKQSVFTEVDTTYLLLHTSWESVQLAWYGQWVDTQDKGAGKATTYALKNTLINTFLIPTWEDTDNTHSDDISVPQKQYWDKPKPKYFNYKDLVEVVEAGNTTEAEIAKVIKEDWFTLSGNAKKALRHYCDTGEISNDIFFGK